ncbi:glutathione S-transferase family protein [Altererythrobacter sp.]|uniref:glutathione S-transferase family protein n=1 Tax=Altererythrobacter sp. TaxID=1872480 RepID=UPI003D02563E
MIEFYTAATPNGWKVSIALEELGLPYRLHPINLGENEQKTPEYLRLNPNGRIPTIVDDDADGEPMAVFESGAILLYLAEKTGALIPADSRGRWETLQWIMFQAAGLGPMMGQAAVFLRYAPERLDYAIERYQRESRRLLEVLDSRLADREWLVGDDFSVADIAHWSWAHTYEFIGLDISGLDGLARWIERIGARPAVQRGIAIPQSIDLTQIDEAEIERRRGALA